MCFVQSITDINQYISYISLLFDHKTIVWGKRSPGLKQRIWQCAEWLVLLKISDRNYISLSSREGMIIIKAIPKELLQKRLFSATWSTKDIGLKSPKTCSPGSATRSQAASKRPIPVRARWIGWRGKSCHSLHLHTCKACCTTGRIVFQAASSKCVVRFCNNAVHSMRCLVSIDS